MATLTPRVKIEKGQITLVRKHTFFGQLVLELRLMEGDVPGQCNTIGTDGKSLYFNPEFIEKNDEDEVLFLWAHELGHIMFDHCSGFNRRFFPEPIDERTLTMALEYEVNSAVKKWGIGKMPAGGLYDPKFDGDDWPAERIYRELMKQQKQNKRKQEGGDGKGNKKSQSQSGQGQPGDSLDSHETWGKAIDKDGKMSEMSEAQKVELTETWKRKIAQAAQVARQQGKLPAGMDRLINKILYPKKPVKDIIEEFIRPINLDYTWTPVDRRFAHADISIPNVGATTGMKIVFAVDTSGSVNEDDLGRYLGWICDAARSTDALDSTVIDCDARVHQIIPIASEADVMKIHPRGGGGTDFRPVFEAVQEKDLRPDALIYITDAEGTFPESAPDYPVLWIIRNSYNKKATAPWGRIVKWEEDD